MSKEITDWVKYELYPNLFDRIDTALPEHNFKRYAGGWKSKTYLNGSPHKHRDDKTVVTKTAPGRILEQGGDSLTLVDYVIRRDGGEFIDAVKTLADVVGLQLPKGEYNKEEYEKRRTKDRLLEDCNSYFKEYYKNANLPEIREYLDSRGYTDEDIEAMELGFIPSQKELIDYLETCYAWDKQYVLGELAFNYGIGKTHQLTIPYRSGGVIKGFKFRTVGDVIPKYLNSTGLDRLGGFFNLSGIKGDKDVVIVEGELDSLHATVKGVENVVATGGSSIASEQIKDAIRRGAKSFTLCFDREPQKEEETAKRIDSAIEVILGEGVNKVYIVTLPDLDSEPSIIIDTNQEIGGSPEWEQVAPNKGEKTDPDRLIKEWGVDSFKEAIEEALPYYEYRLQETLNKYGKIEENRDLQPKDIDRLLNEVVETASKIPEATDRDRYKKLFISLEAIKGLGITEESLSITVDRLTSTKDKEHKAKDFKRLLSEANKLQDKGEVDKALELLNSKVKEVKLKDKATEFSSLLIPIKEDELKERQANKPESISSGYTIGGEPLLLPSGAISIFTAPTSHGKTTFLINLALNVATASPDKETYFFSYEEDGDSILINTLNTYLNKDLSASATNSRTLKSYFTTGSTEYIKQGEESQFIAKKYSFFKEYIEPKKLNIHYSNYNSDTLIEAIRYLHKTANPGAIFIDYIQLLNLPQGKYKTYSRQEELKEICIALKDVAVETGLPIILGAQFNREVVNQLRIHATKIGEAGDIERIANLIIGFWNNNFKPIASEGELNEINNKGASKPNTIYATILKNRGGKVGGEEILSFNGNTGKIENSSSENDYFAFK